MTAGTFQASTWSCAIRLIVEDERILEAASRDLMTLLFRVDRTASRFQSDSALSIANKHAGRPVPVPRLLIDLVAAAIEAAQQTDGLLDPTIGAAMRRIGYDRDIREVTNANRHRVQGLGSRHGGQQTSGQRHGGQRTGGRAPARDWRDIRLYRDAGLLTVPAGTSLDLGATAKSYIADHAARALSSRYDTAVLVEIGGDLAVAGVRPQGWCIEVAERAGGEGQLVLVQHGGLATSTTTVRHWSQNGTPVHHIIDPRTGVPAAGPWRTASVFAPTALAANVASTAAIVLGDDAVEWLVTRHIAARLIDHDGRVETTPGWPGHRAPGTSSSRPGLAAA